MLTRFWRSRCDGFTLVEVLLTTALFGVFMVLLFQVYILIAQMAVRVEQEKLLQQEALFAMQTLQNMLDESTVDRYRYPDLDWSWGQISWVWSAEWPAWAPVDESFVWWSHRVDAVYLRHDDDTFSLFHACDAEVDRWWYVLTDLWRDADLGPYCTLFLWTRDEVAYPLFSPSHVVLPYVDWYLMDGGLWMVAELQSRYADSTQRQFNVRLPIQTFFTLSR